MSLIWILIIAIILIVLIVGIVLFLILRNKSRTTMVVSNDIPVSSETEELPIEYVSERDYRPFRVIGASDGSWFQVLDRQGEIVASFSSPTGEPTFEAECTEGQVEFIGVRSTIDGDKLGPIGCAIPANNTVQYVGQEGNIQRMYSLGRVSSNECPSGLKAMMNSPGITGVQQDDTIHLNGLRPLPKGITYICVPDVGCIYHRDCPDDNVCSGGKCVPPEDF